MSINDVYSTGPDAQRFSAASLGSTLFVKATFSFSGAESASLSFSKGDLIEVITQLPSGWWDGMIVPNKERGWFPSNYVVAASEQESQWARDQLEQDEEAQTQLQSDFRPPRDRDSTARPEDAAGADDGYAQFMGRLNGMNGFGGDDEDLTSFSQGGDIFREIAGAAAAASYHASPALDRDDEYDLPVSMSRQTSGASFERVGQPWVPRVGDNGQIVYYNTQTGQITEERPSDGATRSRSDVHPRTADDSLRWNVSAANDVARALQLKLDVDSLQIAPPIDDDVSPASAGSMDRRDSQASDDSALDAAMQPGARRPLPRLTTAVVPETPSTQSGQSGSVSTTTLAARQDPLASLEPSASPTLSALESRTNEALSGLIEAAHPRRRMSVASGESDDQQAAVRERLTSLLSRVIVEIRALMLAADVVDNASAPSSPTSGRSGAFPPLEDATPLAAYQSEIRPFTRRVMSTLSKLVLSVRAVWGLLGSSAAEEAAYMASFAGDAEIDLVSLRAHREDTLRLRAETETKLRWDVVDGAREVQDSVIKFVDEVERLLGSPLTASTPTPRRDRATIPALRRPSAIVRLQASPAMPGAGQAGNWRGNGFSAPDRPEDGPSTTLVAPVLDNLRIEAKSVVDEVNSMRSLMAAIAAKANRRGSAASRFSNSSSRPNTPGSGTFPPPPLQNQPAVYTPLQSAARHMTKLSAALTSLLSALGLYLAAAEDIDVSGRVDCDLQPSIGAALQAAFASESGQEAGVAGHHVELYLGSLARAMPLLNGLERARQALYDASPALLLAVQSIGLAASHESAIDAARETGHAGAQPSIDSPLTLFGTPARHGDPLASIAATLGAIETGVGFVVEAFQALLAVANEQDALPVELRRRAQQLRVHSASRSHRSQASTTVAAPGVDRRSQLRSPGLGSGDEDARTETSSADGDFFYGSRLGSNSTVNTSLARLSADLKAARGISAPRQRDSYPSSMGSSQREALAATSFPMSRSNTEPSSTGTDDSYAPQPQHSPSRSKLRKFFGDDAPPASRNRPGQEREELPPWLEADFEEEISFNLEGQVKGGTLRALVARLTSHETSDHSYLTTFLMTYRTFATSDELFDQLVERYSMVAPPELTPVQREQWTTRKFNIVQLRTVNVFKIWIESHLWDDDVERILQRAVDFAPRMGRYAQQIIKVVQSRGLHGSKRITNALSTAPPPPPISLRSSKKVKFLDIDPLELARQLTLLDSRLCQRIPARECLSKAWPKQLGAEAPNITAMTSLGNAITNWVVDTILRQDDVRKRANTIKHFVAVAERCRSLQNFSTLIHLVAGLYTTPIHRLRRTWDIVNQRTMATLQELNTLMSPTRNFAEYRETIRTVGPPCVPFVGVFLTSWTFIGDGNPDFLRERPDQINFNKRLKAAELIQQIQLHQSTPYNLSEVQAIRQFLDAAFAAEYDDQVFYQMSLALEPRERDDDRVARMLSESGFL